MTVGFVYLSLECVDLLHEHLLLLPGHPEDLVGLDAVRHELEVGVVLLAELLQQPRVLLLHVLERLARHLHLRHQGLLLLLVIRHLHNTS